MAELVISLDSVNVQIPGPVQSFMYKNSISGSWTGGRIYILSGTNGAGKTTLLNVIAGIAESYIGRVEVSEDGNKFDPARWSRMQGKLSYLLQKNPAPDDLKIDQFLRLASLRSLAPAFREAAPIALADTSRGIGTLSGGERQFLGLAVALSRPAKLYLLDEPTRHLDVERTELVLQLVGRLALDGACVILVQHAHEEALSSISELGASVDIIHVGGQKCES
jgi:ABC-2 type transport system ATP-binding protein